VSRVVVCSPQEPAKTDNASKDEMINSSLSFSPNNFLAFIIIIVIAFPITQKHKTPNPFQ